MSVPIRKYELSDGRFGAEAQIMTAIYAGGNCLAVELLCLNQEDSEAAFWEPLARLSVYIPHKSEHLPRGCFYVKDWSENELVVEDAAASGWFKRRDDLGYANSGWCVAEVWELLDEQGEGFEFYPEEE